jgi:hypothetical protein
MRTTVYSALGATVLAVLGSAPLLYFSPYVSTQEVSPATETASAVGVSSVSVGVVSPVSAEAESLPAPRLTPAELDALIQRHLARRERMDALVNNQPAGPPGLAETAGRQLQLAEQAETDFHIPPALSSLVIGRNSLNTRARTVGVGSTLAEPTTVNEGIRVLYTGNTHAEFSTDGGVTFPAANNIPLPAGPATAPFVCCDFDTVYDQARGVTFWIALYLNAAGTQGSVRIFVRRQIQLANNCSYTITPGAGIVPDFPKVEVGNNHLYLSTNNVGPPPARLQVRRFNIDQMADCQSTAVTTFTLAPAVGQRVVNPVDGIRNIAYFAYHENATQIRIFSWPDTAAAPTSVLRGISAHNHANPDCRGGANNLDWLEGSTSFSITGFRLRGAVGASGRLGFWWNVSADAAAGHNQAHVHAAMFNTTGLTLVAQPHIFNSGFCFGYPAVAANERGDIGLSIAAGGRAGGGGLPVRGFVGIDDDFTPGIGVFGTVFQTCAGTHNPANQRYGDYLSVSQHEPCDLAFTATCYAHNGGTGVAQVNARYVEFLRGRDNQCYVGWRDETRIP